MITVFMYPDYSDWEADDLRWKAGYHVGIKQTFSALEEAKAIAAYNNAYELEFTVAMVYDPPVVTNAEFYGPGYDSAFGYDPANDR